MPRLARFTLAGFLATMFLACSGKVTDPEKMIEIAAKHESPHSRLTELYKESVLPKSDVYEAWSMAEQFAQNALKGTNTGYQYDTVDFPWSVDRSAVDDDGGSVEKATGKPFRNYHVKAEFHANNLYGARTRLRLSVFMRTPDNETWQAYQIYVSDPSKPTLLGGVFAHETDAWDGFELLSAPDSLYAQLDFYIKRPSKETGVQKKREYGWEIEGPFVKGKKHGHFVERNSHGVVFEGQYVNDKRHGPWVRRNKEGEVIEEGDYVDGEKHGRWNDPGGIGNYVHGKKQGRWNYRDTDGVVETADYVDGKPHGRWNWRKPDGETGGGEFVHGKKKGQWVVLTFMGGIEKGRYVDGKKQGQWVEYLVTGIVYEGVYVDGKKHGRWVERRTGGIVDEGDFVDGKKHGWWTRRSSDGTVHRIRYERGTLELR